MNVIVVDDEPLALRGIGRLVREAAAADDKDAGGDAACADAPATVGGGVATSAAGDVVSDGVVMTKIVPLAYLEAKGEGGA